MKLSECWMGRIVNSREIMANEPNFGKAATCRNPKTGFYYTLVGHIIGFDLNCTNETIVRVKWNNGEETVVHPGNLLIMED